MSPSSGERTKDKGRVYVIEVDGREYTVEQDTITGGEMMDLTGIPRDAGLVQILDDGTQKQVAADEVIQLKPGHRFKKRPRFQRG